MAFATPHKDAAAATARTGGGDISRGFAVAEVYNGFSNGSTPAGSGTRSTFSTIDTKL